MNATIDKRLIRPSRWTRRARRLSATCLALALRSPALAAAGCAAQETAKAAPSESSCPGEAPAQPATPPFVRTDRAVKLRLLQRLAKPPRILIFDGSRATRIEPDDFYDGFHVHRANARRPIRTIVGAFLEAFGGETAPTTGDQ